MMGTPTTELAHPLSDAEYRLRRLIGDVQGTATRECRIDMTEARMLRARWLFGQLLHEKRNDRGLLPNRYMSQLVEWTGKSRSEILYRERFFVAFPTEDRLAQAISEFGAWDHVVEHLKVVRRRITDGWS